jgi:hypothetical protein
MKLVTCGAAALMILVPTLASAQTAPAAKPAVNPARAAAEKTLIANEHAINEAVSKGDKAALLALVAPDGVAANSNGFIPAKLFVEAIPQIKLTKWEIANPQVIWIEPTSAIVTYTFVGEGTFQGKPLPPKAISSTVWTKKSGKWLALFHQETAAGQ